MFTLLCQFILRELFPSLSDSGALYISSSASSNELKGRVSHFCAWANCHVGLFNSIVIEKIESTDAGNGNNVNDVKVKLLVGITFAIISFVL